MTAQGQPVWTGKFSHRKSLCHRLLRLFLRSLLRKLLLELAFLWQTWEYTSHHYISTACLHFAMSNFSVPFTSRPPFAATKPPPTSVYLTVFSLTSHQFIPYQTVRQPKIPYFPVHQFFVGFTNCLEHYLRRKEHSLSQEKILMHLQYLWGAKTIKLMQLNVKSHLP